MSEMDLQTAYRLAHGALSSVLSDGANAEQLRGLLEDLPKPADGPPDALSEALDQAWPFLKCSFCETIMAPVQPDPEMTGCEYCRPLLAIVRRLAAVSASADDGKGSLVDAVWAASTSRPSTDANVIYEWARESTGDPEDQQFVGAGDSDSPPEGVDPGSSGVVVKGPAPTSTEIDLGQHAEGCILGHHPYRENCRIITTVPGVPFAVSQKYVDAPRPKREGP